jgi:hypothetical protein
MMRMTEPEAALEALRRIPVELREGRWRREQ